MGKIILIMGKSSSGKDHIYKGLLKNSSLNLKKVVLYTTRPMRQGEQDGVQYYFTDEKDIQLNSFVEKLRTWYKSSYIGNNKQKIEQWKRKFIKKYTVC